MAGSCPEGTGPADAPPPTPAPPLARYLSLDSLASGAGADPQQQHWRHHELSRALAAGDQADELRRIRASVADSTGKAREKVRSLHGAIQKLDRSSLSVEELQSNVLQSPDGTFSCGFYSIYANAFMFSIWYSNSAEKTIIWSANRDRPVHARRSMLTVKKDGSMVLTDYDGTVVWHADGDLIDARYARLLDTGNLVLEGASGPGIKRRLTLDPDGNLRIYSLNSSDGSWQGCAAIVNITCGAAQALFPDVHKTDSGESNWIYFYGYKELEMATANFKDELGRGGSGVVYKGILDDNRAIAVKRLENVRQGKQEMLVYEFVENGSLATILFNSNILVGWKQRFNIAVENILLDQNFEPKIIDFGLAKLLRRSGSNQIISQVRGTRASDVPVGLDDELHMELRKLVRTLSERLNREEHAWIAEFVDEDRNKRPTMEAVVQILLSSAEADSSMDQVMENEVSICI
ncbi:putative receptor protein kinase ZmPK1 [Dichanthelium oligosanthes]|uniref:non-specific serine/threonine protein kinase n=1 Tax=Dichanthelium oligosanthes TaxID=888268 RepID=A0A1E5V923_9POAL|nr:putative receptor protein kinase ZmPK1 [Dichanthelium oligosanthes]